MSDKPKQMESEKTELMGGGSASLNGWPGNQGTAPAEGVQECRRNSGAADGGERPAPLSSDKPHQPIGYVFPEMVNWGEVRRVCDLHRDRSHPTMVPVYLESATPSSNERCFDAAFKALAFLDSVRFMWNGPIHRAAALLREATGPQPEKAKPE